MLDTITTYSNTNRGNMYQLVLEYFDDDITNETIIRLVKKYPRLKNICYGWGEDYNTSKPDFIVDNPLKVLNDVWRNVNCLPIGYYIVAARDQKTLNIYHRRWLSNPKWIIKESGVICGDTPFLVLNKCAR